MNVTAVLRVWVTGPDDEDVDRQIKAIADATNATVHESGRFVTEGEGE